ncbi:MAG: peptide-methionine (R)-S-oxide reductase MsrB [Pseudomonadota bacterium]
MAKPNPNVEIKKSDKEWQQQLSPEQYRITRKHGTERPHTGPHLHQKADGTYACVCCGNPLFEGATKFESGTGWPSFFAPLNDDSVAEYTDRSFFMVRTEVRCAKCDAHLGHVFPDGPQPTGQRYCMNGHAMTFEPNDAS